MFNAIIVDVANGSRDLYNALDAQFDLHKVLVGTRKVPRFGTIEHLPPFLQVNVQRVGFDLTTKLPFKVENHLQLPEVLYMDRYVAGDAQLLRRRRRAWEWKEKLRELEWHREVLTKTPIKDMKMPDVLDATYEFVSKLESEKDAEDDDLMDVDPIAIDTSLGEELQSRSKELADSLKEVETRISGLKTSIKDQFDGMEQHGYRLHALFIHRGSAGAGHYWIYIRDFKRNVWIKYNDDHVDIETDMDNIFKEDPRNPSATPYFLVYVRQGMEDRLVESLCRRPLDSALDAGMVNGEPEIIEGVDADAALL